MNVFFDVDDTLITWDVRLRPHVAEVFQQIRDDGHVIYLWSGYGPRWEVVKRFDLADHIVSCHWKPLYDHHKRLPELGVPMVPDFCVDDHAEIIDAFGGFHIQPASSTFFNDREMWRAYEALQAFIAKPDHFARNLDG